MLIYFARHGQTDDNVRRIMQGHRDVSMNKQGRKESWLLAERLKVLPIKEIHSSNLSRAKETAEICAALHPGLAVQGDDGLKERNLGSLQGKLWPKGTPAPADVESMEALGERATKWFKTFLDKHILQMNDPTNDQPILIVTHGAYLMSLQSVLLDEQNENWRFTAPVSIDEIKLSSNTSLMSVEVKVGLEGRYEGRILSWNDTKHLEGWEEEVLGGADDAKP